MAAERTRAYLQLAGNVERPAPSRSSDITLWSSTSQFFTPSQSSEQGSVSCVQFEHQAPGFASHSSTCHRMQRSVREHRRLHRICVLQDSPIRPCLPRAFVNVELVAHAVLLFPARDRAPWLCGAKPNHIAPALCRGPKTLCFALLRSNPQPVERLGEPTADAFDRAPR